MRDRIKHIGLIERLHCFKTFPLFEGLPNDSLAVLARYARECFFRRRTTVLQAGVPVGRVHIVVEGRVLVRREAGRAIYAGPGQAVGMLGFFAQNDNDIQAIAEVDTTTLAFDVETFMEILDDHFAVLFQFIRNLSGRLVDANRKSRTLSTSGEIEIEATGSEDLAQRIITLHNGLPFARASISLLASLARQATEVKFTRDQILFENKPLSDSFFIVSTGNVSCNGTDDEPFQFTVGPGSTLGLCESIAERPLWYRPVAAGPVTGLQLDIEALIDVFEFRSDTALEYMSWGARELVHALEQDAPLRLSIA